MAGKSNKKIRAAAVLCALLALAILSMFMLHKITGYTFLDSQAGYITSLLIVHKQDTAYWQGYYGLDLMQTQFNEIQTDLASPGNVREKHLIFSCLEPGNEHEVYAAPVDLTTLDWTDARPGTVQMADDYAGISPGSLDSAANTFNKTGYYMIGDSNISGVPTAYTYVNGDANSQNFSVGILNISGQMVFAAKVTSTIRKNYKGGSSNYQMLVALPNASTTYYFGSDPFESCPEGLQSGLMGDGYFTGYVTSNETGVPLPNVTVSISDAVTTTGEDGFYNATVPIGYHVFTGVKDGFNTRIGTANISLSETTWANFSLSEFRGPDKGNGTVIGTVRNNATYAALSGAMVSVAGRTVFSGATGNYSINATIGEYVLVSSKGSYQNHIGNVTINYTNTTIHDIYLAPTTGTLEGFAFRSDTGGVLEGVTVSAEGISTATNSSGKYILELSPGTHAAIANKTGYNSDADQIEIIAGMKAFLNFTLEATSGTLNGIVYGNVTNSTLEGARIYVGNNMIITTSAGNFSATLPAGTQLLWAIMEGYETLVEQVTVVNLEETNVTVRLRPTNGTLTGNVTDILTSQPIANATVSINGVFAMTDGTGIYNLTAFTGTHVFAATKPGYETAAGNATIEPGLSTTKDIQLTASNITPQGGIGFVLGQVTDETGAALENVTVSMSGHSNLTNTTGHYYLNTTEGVHNLAGAKEGYQTYVSAVTINATKTTIHNFNMSLVVVQGLGSGLGTGLGAGLSPGKGPGTGVTSKPTTPQVQAKEKTGVKKMLTISRILKRLSQGTFLTFPLTIVNYKDTPALVNLEITGEVSSMMSLDKTAVVLGPNENIDIMLTILGTSDPGIYNGTLHLSGDIDESIPIDVLLLDKNKLPIETLQMRVELFDKRVNPGSPFKFRVDLQNLLKTDEYPVKLSYTLRHQELNTSYSFGDEETILRTSQSILKDFTIPDKAPTGDYTLVVDADYIGFSSSYTSAFSVILPLYKYSFFGVVSVWMIAVILAVLSTGTFSVMTYKKQQAKKKRYQIQVDYKSLPKAGPRSAFVGKIAETQNRTYFDLDLFQLHTLIAGSSGSGKTVAATVLVEEALAHGVSVIVFDPTAQWTGFLRKMTEKKMLALYQAFGMKQSDARGFNGNVRQINDKREVIDIKKFMRPGEITCFAINKLEPEDIDVIVANTVKQVFKARLPESKELRLLIVFDEVHRLLPKFGGSGQGFLQIERAAREFRKWGVGLLLISQVLTDFVGEIKANINTEIQMRSRDETDLKRIEEAYGAQVLKSVVKASIGTGMIENSAYNRGKPFFVSFRPMLHNHAALADAEMDNYNKYNLILDDIEFQLGQLKAEGIDIFDLELEAKLAKDKLKSGNFSTVDIYLESVNPRIEEEWKKIGKEPQHYKITLSEDTGNEDAKPKTEDVKAEQKKETPEAAATASSPPAVPTIPGEAKNLISRINEKIGSGSKEEAKQLYAELSRLYGSMGKEQKALIFAELSSIYKRMAK